MGRRLIASVTFAQRASPQAERGETPTPFADAGSSRPGCSEARDRRGQAGGALDRDGRRDLRTSSSPSIYAHAFASVEQRQPDARADGGGVRRGARRVGRTSSLVSRWRDRTHATPFRRKNGPQTGWSVLVDGHPDSARADSDAAGVSADADRRDDDARRGVDAQERSSVVVRQPHRPLAGGEPEVRAGKA